ncbi:hypothetical protein MTER_42170 [Mycolicibacter terrae]|uniref:Uncharacterized protein n=1 Tax=Mycolicibacter terrae TaxID=1788 RepID=A0AAD1MJF3_9MYCO|nr:hypothetical protein [Mycolicibacter terrae]ORW95138.1 hypothetical protein AWC28_12135 [Mycolicibacter terrae]BBX24806.1 hypothetical protein MTER_42170 [Mycolicibacter terrae]SNV95081.1 Uncharacterised protein [Mycolicibacter terrae]
MSLISIAAPLIRLAAVDDDRAQDLFDAVNPERDETARIGLIRSGVEPTELAVLTSPEWQWFAEFRQALGGELDPVVLDHLTDSASTRFARYAVRRLVLRDPTTNADARDGGDPADRPAAIGLNWLSRQAKGERIIADFDLVTDDERVPVFEEMPETVFEPMREELLELMRDGLQCATDAAWFLLREMTSLAGRRGALVSGQLEEFARDRAIASTIWEHWGLHEPPRR